MYVICTIWKRKCWILYIIRHIATKSIKLINLNPCINSSFNLAGNEERCRSSVSGCVEEDPFLLHQQVHHRQVSVLVIKMKPLIVSIIQIAECADLLYMYIKRRQKEIDNLFDLYNYMNFLYMKTQYVILWMYVTCTCTDQPASFTYF